MVEIHRLGPKLRPTGRYLTTIATCLASLEEIVSIFRIWRQSRAMGTERLCISGWSSGELYKGLFSDGELRGRTAILLLGFIDNFIEMASDACPLANAHRSDVETKNAE